jgi:hypothetical protein
MFWTLLIEKYLGELCKGEFINLWGLAGLSISVLILFATVVNKPNKINNSKLLSAK